MYKYIFKILVYTPLNKRGLRTFVAILTSVVFNSSLFFIFTGFFQDIFLGLLNMNGLGNPGALANRGPRGNGGGSSPGGNGGDPGSGKGDTVSFITLSKLGYTLFS